MIWCVVKNNNRLVPLKQVTRRFQTNVEKVLNSFLYGNCHQLTSPVKTSLHPEMNPCFITSCVQYNKSGLFQTEYEEDEHLCFPLHQVLFHSFAQEAMNMCGMYFYLPMFHLSKPLDIQLFYISQCLVITEIALKQHHVVQWPPFYSLTLCST